MNMNKTRVKRTIFKPEEINYFVLNTVKLHQYTCRVYKKVDNFQIARKSQICQITPWIYVSLNNLEPNARNKQKI